MNDVCYNTQGNAAMFVLYVFIRQRKRLESRDYDMRYNALHCSIIYRSCPKYVRCWLWHAYHSHCCRRL